MSNHWIELCDGTTFDYLEPNYDIITIETVAHSLSNKCRFNGHTKYFYSVAQHCLNVMYAIEDEIGKIHADSLFGLLHDSIEAFIADIPSPLKSMTYLRVNNSDQYVTYSKYEHDTLREFVTNLLQREGSQVTESTVSNALYLVHKYDMGVRVSERDLLFSGERIWNKEIKPLYLNIKTRCSSQSIERKFLEEYYRRIKLVGNNNKDIESST